MLTRLDKVIRTDLIINFYEEETESPDQAVNIFVRINSGGTPLTFSKILLSMTIAGWEKKDAKTEINNLVDSINSKNFNITSDYILKSFLFLYHRDVRTMIKNFNNAFILKIENNWENIRDAILSLFEFLRTIGLNNYSLTSYNATLPILYYIYHKDIWRDFSTRICYKEDRIRIRQWLLKSLLLKSFGGSSDSALQKCRKAFGFNIDNNVFISEEINLYPSNLIDIELQNTDISEQYIINDILTIQKDSKFSFSTLALLYPHLDYNNTSYHQDHLHPAHSYNNLKDEDKEIYQWKTYNSILNLQMLDANENMSKNDMPLKDWVEQESSEDTRSSFLVAHIIPDVSLDIEDFSLFIEKRKQLLIERIRNLFS